MVWIKVIEKQVEEEWYVNLDHVQTIRIRDWGKEEKVFLGIDGASEDYTIEDPDEIARLKDHLRKDRNG